MNNSDLKKFKYINDLCGHSKEINGANHSNFSLRKLTENDDLYFNFLGNE